MISRLSGVSWRRVAILTSIFFALSLPVLWDYQNLILDFESTLKLLRKIRLDTAINDRVIFVRFNGKEGVCSDKKGNQIEKIHIPTLNSVNYRTTLGDNMIVFTGRGTSPYNKREHGGDLRLRSFLGFTKSIWVTCAGLPLEGSYPEE